MIRHLIRNLFYIGFLSLVFSGCINTDPGEEHSNPMDTLYESNGYRIQLYIDEETENGNMDVQWSSIFTNNGERDDGSIKSIVSSELHWIAGSPSAADIENVRNFTFTGTSQAINIKYDDTDGYSGSVEIADPGVKRSYIIRLVLKDDKEITKTVYSNFVVWEP